MEPMIMASALVKSSENLAVAPISGPNGSDDQTVRKQFLPEVHLTPQQRSQGGIPASKLPLSINQQQPQPTVLPDLPPRSIEQQKQKPTELSKPSLYNFYQKIIDRSNPNESEKDLKFKHPNYNVVPPKENKFQSDFNRHNYPGPSISIVQAKE